MNTQTVASSFNEDIHPDRELQWEAGEAVYILSKASDTTFSH